MNRNDSVKKAFLVGGISVFSYVSNYVLRNLLSVLTPFMLKESLYGKEYIALLSTCYMIAYAAGQLLNGILGDRFRAAFMVLTGLSVAGIASVLFPLLPFRPFQIFCFLIIGYGLSMVRGPLMKLITENTTPDISRIICLFFSFSGFAGPLIASIISMLFHWDAAFVVTGGITVFVAFFSFVSIRTLEKKGKISFLPLEGGGKEAILGVFRVPGFCFYLLIACLVEIAGTSVTFWIPTFLSEYLRCGEETSNMIFSGISLVRALVPFCTFALYRLFGGRDRFLMRICYGIAFLCFAGMLIAPAGIGTVVLLLTALIMNGFVSALLWSIYIPGLGKTGRVSSINGILDCSGYIAAGVTTSLFAAVSVSFGSGGLIFAWCVLPVLGLAVTFMGIRKPE